MPLQMVFSSNVWIKNKEEMKRGFTAILRGEKQFAIFDHRPTYIYHTGVFS